MPSYAGQRRIKVVTAIFGISPFFFFLLSLSGVEDDPTLSQAGKAKKKKKQRGKTLLGQPLLRFLLPRSQRAPTYSTFFVASFVAMPRGRGPKELSSSSSEEEKFFSASSLRASSASACPAEKTRKETENQTKVSERRTEEKRRGKRKREEQKKGPGLFFFFFSLFLLPHPLAGKCGVVSTPVWSFVSI